MDREVQNATGQEAISAGRIFPSTQPHRQTPVGFFPAALSPAGRIRSGAAARAEAERRLLRRVFTRCDELIQEACRSSSVCAEFLGALTANESGGDPAAVRFEPSVYRHLKAVAAGERPRYDGISAEALCKELLEVLHPKTGEFHAVFLNSPSMAGQARELSCVADEALRELASSWGFVQIMGFHVIGRRATVRDLVEPRFHYHFAIQLLAEFAECYQLDLAREFEEMFRCWNTGRPDGRTADPAYARNGLRRMEIYHELMIERKEGHSNES
jgi:hypothetical protein